VQTKDNGVTKTTNQYVNNLLDTHIDNYTDTVVNYSYNNSGELTQVNETKDNSLVSRVSTIKNTYGMIDTKIVLFGDNTVVSNNYIYKNDPFNRCLVRESLMKEDVYKTTLFYNYDKFGRLTSKNVPFAVNYDYTTLNNGNRLTNQIQKVTYNDNSFEQYEYDANGNITKVTLSNGDTIEYTYDSFNRLIEEVNCAFGQRTLITYDKGGNITQKRVFNCQNGTDETIDYSYDNPWKDQLTSIGGQPIVYDAIGNPTSYKGNTLYWIRGRMLEAFGDKACFTYNSAGVRTEKCVKGVSTKYVIIGSQIVSEETNGIKTIYYYSTDGIIGFNYNGTDYFYRKNLQGDIIAILNTSGGIVAKYVYDAWGNNRVFNSAGTVIYDSQNPTAYTANANHIGCLNPIRYRGYYFDIETGLYYLQSRYYDPQIGRFINADAVAYIKPETFSGLNLYAYCMNNPIMYIDAEGHAAEWWQWLLFGVVSLVAIGLVVAAFTPAALAASASSMLFSIGTGFLTAAGASIVIQSSSIGLENINPIDALVSGLIGSAIGAASSLVSGIFGSAGKIYGELIGNALGRMRIMGVSVGSIFNSGMISTISGFIGEVGGAFVGGAIANGLANTLHNEKNKQSLSFEQSASGVFEDLIFKFFRWLLR